MELNELRGSVWQETARWVGFEENFNAATGKWGSSHVSYLTFKSLIQLRKLMSTGELRDPNVTEICVCMLQCNKNQTCFSFVNMTSLFLSSGAYIFDLNASSLSAVAEKVADELVESGNIRADDRDSLLRALLLRRR